MHCEQISSVRHIDSIAVRLRYWSLISVCHLEFVCQIFVMLLFLNWNSETCFLQHTSQFFKSLQINFWAARPSRYSMHDLREPRTTTPPHLFLFTNRWALHQFNQNNPLLIPSLVVPCQHGTWIKCWTYWGKQRYWVVVLESHHIAKIRNNNQDLLGPEGHNISNQLCQDWTSSTSAFSLSSTKTKESSCLFPCFGHVRTFVLLVSFVTALCFVKNIFLLSHYCDATTYICLSPILNLESRLIMTKPKLIIRAGWWRRQIQHLH